MSNLKKIKEVIRGWQDEHGEDVLDNVKIPVMLDNKLSAYELEELFYAGVSVTRTCDEKVVKISFGDLDPVFLE